MNAMNRSRRRFLHLAASAAALPAVSRMAWAQAYPTRPVRAVVAFAPGGVTDTFARLMAQKLTEQLGKQVYVENIAGASGNIGTGQVAKAARDGYTILFAFSSHVVNPTLFARVPYDPIKDFDPVTLAVASTTVLTVNPAVPAKTVKELVDLIKANPGKYSFGSAGAGTQAHLAGEQFRLSLGLDLVHVPFGGGGPAVAALAPRPHRQIFHPGLAARRPCKAENTSMHVQERPCLLAFASFGRIVSKARPICGARMHADMAEIGARRGPKMRPLTLGHLDRRTRASRRARELAAFFTAELGGELAAGQRLAVERAAVLVTISQDAEARRLRGDAVPLDDIVRTARLARMAVRDLGLDLRPRQPVEPVMDLKTYAAAYVASRS
jgi:Tripartite tricarboxylate transporter family receptor